eukprot:c21638_g1_i1 orf=105-2243(+)
MGLEAHTAVRLYPSQLLKLQQKARFSPPIAITKESLQGSKRKLICSANPHHHQQQQTNEEAQLRADISPSVLRALQPQDPNSSPTPSGESLIERNLRKRAMAQGGASSSSPSTEQSSSVHVSGGAECSDHVSVPEEQGSAALLTSPKASTSIPAEQGSLLGYGESESSPRDAMSNTCPITAAFWQETPPGFSMENFHNLDFYVSYFRLSLLLHITLAEESEDFPVSSLFWLLLPSNELPMSLFPEEGENLLLEWQKDVAENLGKITNNKAVLSGATEIFSTLWNPKPWADRVTSGKAMDLVIVLAYSSYVYILSGAAKGATSMKSRLEECSASLNHALTQLHGSVLDPVGIWERALKGTSFALDGRAYVYDHALIFPCRFSSSGARSELGCALEEVQQCLDKEFQGLDLVALLHRSSDDQEQYFVLIAPWYWVLTGQSQQFAPIPGILAILSCLATTQFPGAGLDFGFSWEQYVVPLGWAGIIASIFLINNRQIPTVCPFPGLGAIGKFMSDLGNLPSRKSLVRAILKASSAPLAVSLLLLACGLTFWGPSQYYVASVIDFSGYVLVPPELFSYSGILTKLLQSASVATIQGEDGGSKLAASPFVLGGLLGLNFTAFNLFPGVGTDGSYLLRSLLRSKKLANEVTFVCTVILTLSLCAQNPYLGLGWLAVSLMSETHCFVKDDVSDPDLLTSLAGSVLVAGALACFIPFLQY